jgi:hypothetical protein
MSGQSLLDILQVSSLYYLWIGITREIPHMQVSKVTEIDVKMVAQLMKALKVGRFDLVGEELAVLADTMRWVGHVAVQMASSLRESADQAKSAAAQEDSGFRVKAVDPVPALKGVSSGSTKKGGKSGKK